PAKRAPGCKTTPRVETRRKHVRTKVKFGGCIPSYRVGEDIVKCEDMSRGGLCFNSRKEYAAKAQIEVAATFSPGTQAIFVRGQIVHVTELKRERRFRCGVCYAKS